MNIITHISGALIVCEHSLMVGPPLYCRFSGYLFVKVGKIAACTLGTTVILIQVLVPTTQPMQSTWTSCSEVVNAIGTYLGLQIRGIYLFLLCLFLNQILFSLIQF